MNCFLLRSDTATSIKKLQKLTGLDESTTLYKSIRPKQINISKEKVPQVTEFIEETRLNILYVGKSRMRYFSQKQLISKGISFHALIKKSYHKWFWHIMAKIRRTKGDGNVKVAELNRIILGALNSGGLALSRLWEGLWALSKAEGSARAPCLPGFILLRGFSGAESVVSIQLWSPS